MYFRFVCTLLLLVLSIVMLVRTFSPAKRGEWVALKGYVLSSIVERDIKTTYHAKGIVGVVRQCEHTFAQYGSYYGCDVLHEWDSDTEQYIVLVSVYRDAAAAHTVDDLHAYVNAHMPPGTYSPNAVARFLQDEGYQERARRLAHPIAYRQVVIMRQPSTLHETAPRRNNTLS